MAALLVLQKAQDPSYLLAFNNTMIDLLLPLGLSWDSEYTTMVSAFSNGTTSSIAIWYYRMQLTVFTALYSVSAHGFWLNYLFVIWVLIHMLFLNDFFLWVLGIYHRHAG